MIIKKKTILIFSISLGVLMSIPIGIYIIHFATFDFSDDPIQWGVLSDYLGGVLNPIISLSSLLVLGYLTFVMSKQGVEENRNLFLLQQKMAAYQELAKYIKEISILPSKIGSVNYSRFFNELYTDEQAIRQMQNQFNKIQEDSFIITDFYFTLQTFELKYGHLFKYNFNNQDFINTLKKTEAINNTFENFFKTFSNKNPIDSFQLIILMDIEYLTKLLNIIHELRLELEK